MTCAEFRTLVLGKDLLTEMTYQERMAIVDHMNDCQTCVEMIDRMADQEEMDEEELLRVEELADRDMKRLLRDPEEN